MNASNSISAHWGDPNLTESVKSYTVDGSTWSNQFKGVWHYRPMSLTTTLTDSTFYRNHLEDTSGFTEDQAILSSGRSFAGGPDQFIQVPGSYSLDDLSQESFTFSTWIKVENLPDDSASNSFLGLGYQTPWKSSFYTDIENLKALTPSGSRVFQSGPRQGLFLENDGDFKRLEIGITRNDQYMSLFLASFAPPEDGIYMFRCEHPDDVFAFWIDLDGDNLFEAIGSAGSEKILTQLGYAGNVTLDSTPVSLSFGQRYLIAIAHGEGNGGSRLKPWILTPSQDWRIIDPSDPSQNGYYSVPFDGTLSSDISSFAFYKQGSRERFDFRDGVMGMTHLLKNEAIEVQSVHTPDVDQWTHVASQVDLQGQQLRIFKNGLQVHAEPFSPSTANILPGQSWFVGSGDIAYVIDETRLSSSARSAAWIKASYDNQKQSPDFPLPVSEVSGSHSFTSTSEFFLNAEKPFFNKIEATGNPSAFVASGLPPGIALNPDPVDGNLSGIPSRAGVYDTQLRAIYADGSQAYQDYKFTVFAGAPEVSISSPQTETTNSLRVDYEITATGGDDPEVFLLADTVDHGKDLYKWKFRLSLGRLGLGPGSALIDGLNADAIYYVRMYAVNSVGEDWTGKDAQVRLQPLKNHLPMGLAIWFDATDVLADQTEAIEGAALSVWRDKSGFQRDMDNARGDPSIKMEGHQGKPVVDFDGNDQLWTTFAFNGTQDFRNMGYVAFGVSRYAEGGNGRVISSVGSNWLMGHHGNLISRYFLNGWVYGGYAADTNFHLWEISHEGRNANADPEGTIWTDGIQLAQNRNSAWWGFEPSKLSFGAYEKLAEASKAQVAEFVMIRGSIEESERLLLEGYLCRKWGIQLPSEHPWAFETPTFGEIVTEGATPVGITSQTLSPIIVNRKPANQTDTSASLSGQLISAGLGLVEDAPFAPSDYSGMRLWLDASDADGDGETGSSTHFDANPVQLLGDKSGQGNDASQAVNASQPLFVSGGINGMPSIRFDGSDDFLQFDEISTIRTAFFVLTQNSGNQGFLLGHENSYSFHRGANTVWSDLWTDTYLLNGILQIDGRSLDGLSQGFSYGIPTIVSLRTTGMLTASNFSKDRSNSVYWNGDLAELIVYQEELPVSTMRMVEGYLAHKWGIVDSLVSTHPYKGFAPVRSKPATATKIYWGGSDGGKDPNAWENVIDVGEVSLGLRKLSGGVTLIATPPPNQDAGTYPASKLLDGQLPADGWRSTWTAWFKSNPLLTFNLGKTRLMNKLRIYFQPYERAGELKEVAVYVADEEMNFGLLDEFAGGAGPVQQGKYVEFDMNGIETQAIRLEPEYDGWGHMWGEVEFWVRDTGEFEAPVYGLAPGQTYYYRSFGSNNGGSVWAPYTESFRAQDKVAYDSGKLVIHTDLGTWKHSNGDTRNGTILEQSFTDQFGNSIGYKVCRFEFDEIELIGDLEIQVKGNNALEVVTTTGDILWGVELDLSGKSSNGEVPGESAPGGFQGGQVASRGIGPGGGLGGVLPGGGGYGGAGARATSSTGQPYGDGAISKLLGGSGGGGYTVDSAGGGGGGALRIESAGNLKLLSAIRAIGGSGTGGSAGGSGGSVHLKASNLELSKESLIDVSGGINGGAGGRIYLEGEESLNNQGFENLVANGGEGAVSGTGGSVRYLRPTNLAGLDLQSGTLTIDTDAATITHSNGSLAFGEIEDKFYKDKNGAFWPFSVCRFEFTSIHLGGNLVVRLIGKNGLEMEATSGSLILGSNLKANGADAEGAFGGKASLGGFPGVNAGEIAGNGPGSPLYSSTVGHGAAFGNHGSGEAKTYGDRDLAALIGGSAGGSSSTSGSGAGGGVISLKAASEIVIEPNVLVSANGGNGSDDSASGTGGAIRLEATRILNHGTLQARAGNGAKTSENDQTRGSSGGRIALIANGLVKVGETDVSGEWLSNEGSVFVGGSYLDSTLDVENAELTINTGTGYFSVEGGAHGVGIFTPQTYVDNLGQSWNFESCSFTFSQISITGESTVRLLGDKPLILKTVASGDVRIHADMILDGGDASTANGYGGRPVLNPWRGRSSEKLNGFGPGGPLPSGNWGVGANYNYGDDQISSLLPGSSGSSGSSFQGSGAGGGALSLEADGDLIIGDGVVLSAQGGNGRVDGTDDHGGGGSGGAIRLIGRNVLNKGLIRVDGGNRGAGGGRIAIASGGTIERGVLSVGTGSYKEIKPPALEMPEKLFASYMLPSSVKKRTTVSTRPQNLRAYFPMDEAQGISTLEMVGEKNHNFVGGVSWVEGKIGSAAQFNGSDGYLSTDLSSELLHIDGKKPRTISFWVKIEEKLVDDPGFYGVGSLLNAYGANQYWSIRQIDHSDYTAFQGEYWGWEPLTTHGNSLLSSGWTHFAHLYDGNNVLIYRDATRIFNASRAEISTGKQVPLQIGRWQNDANAYLKGAIDDFRVYDDALNEGEIQTIYVGQDLKKEVLQMQFVIEATDDPTNFSVSGLPAGLSLDSQSGYVTGLPQEVGIFDLNVSVSNQAGQSHETIQLVINKTPPALTSAPPKNLSSTSAKFAGRIVSDGGEPVSLSLFWGDNDGGSSTLVNPSDSTLWDYRIDLSEGYANGGFSHFVGGLDKNSSYFYRWLAGNSVNPQVWSQPTMDGLVQWWKFDENEGSLAENQISDNSIQLIGLNEADRQFGKKGKALRFEGDGGHLVAKAYKGITGSNPRTLSFWLKTSDANASLFSWGSERDNEKWELSLENGLLKLDIQGGIMLGGGLVNDNQWNHVAITLPAGGPLLSDCTIYLNGEVDTVFSSQFDLNPNFVTPDLWLDATDATTMDRGTYGGASGSPALGDAIGFWANNSGGAYHATRLSGSPTFEDALNSTYPGINTNGDVMEIVNSAADFDQLNAFSVTFVVDWLNESTGDKMIWKGNTGWWTLQPTFYIGKFNVGANQGTGVWYAENGSRHYKINGSSATDARSETKIISVVYNGTDGSNRLFSNGFLINTTNGLWSSLPASSSSLRIGGGHRFGDIIIARRAFSNADREYLEGYLGHKFGLNQNLNPNNPYSEVMDYIVKTGSDRDLVIGTNQEGNHFSGLMDEVRLYDRGLSKIEVKSIALDGTIAFTTSSVPRPPSVEIIEATPELNATVRIRGELTGKDEYFPSVSVYYGKSDGGFDPDKWDDHQSLFGGSVIELGEFNSTISGLEPGEKYYFRILAESPDGSDWSSGAPQVEEDLMAYWRMDETNGSLLYDSVYPKHTGRIEGLESDGNRSEAIQGNGVDLDGWSQSIDLDLANDGYLNTSFEGRSFSAWIKPVTNFYSGPAVESHDDLVAYFPSDEGSGATLGDSTVNQLNSQMFGGVSWSAGFNGQALSLDGVNDYVEIDSSGPLNDLHRSSYSISLWIHPNQASPGPHNQGQLRVRGYQVAMSDSYFTNPSNLFNLPSSGNSIFTDGPGSRGLDFQSDGDFTAAGVGVGGDNYLVLFSGSFQAKVAGNYSWEILGNDDRGVLWLDRDQNGLFEISGSQGQEKILDAAHDFDSASLNLIPGYYEFVLIHGEKTGGSTQELKFSTPSSAAGPTILTTVRPSDSEQSDLFVTENSFTLLQRNSLRLGLDGNYVPSFQHSNYSASNKVVANQPINESVWTHLGVVVDYDASEVRMYVGGVEVGTEPLSSREALHLLSTESWLLGGSNPVKNDYFNGKIDDLRFYDKALSSEEVLNIANDDLSFALVAGYDNQIIYDEGTDESGFSIGLEHGVLKARVREGGEMVELSSGAKISGDEWTHLTASFGESPKSFNLYLNGVLADGPVFLKSSATISGQADKPVVGKVEGTSVFPSYFGHYKGRIDEVRIYDRGLDPDEVVRIHDGDFANQGFLEFIAIDKPTISALRPTGVLPDQAIMQVEVLSIGGEIHQFEETIDLTFKSDTFSGMQAWYSSQDTGSSLENGEVMTNWLDLSGKARHMGYTSGNPRYLDSALKGKPIISFDGDDLIWTDHDFGHLVDTGYTMISVSRYTGARNQRVISSRTRNFLFGYHGALTGRWFAQGWISTAGPLDSYWHLHTGIIDKKNNPVASFWRDGEQLVSDSRGSGNNNFDPGQLQFGGWETNRETSACEIAEVMIFDRMLNESERLQLEGYLAHKWSLTDEFLSSSHPHYERSPFGGVTQVKELKAVGGDAPVVRIFWGDEPIEANSTLVDPDDNSSWDFVAEVNGGNPVGLGAYEAVASDLVLDKTYYYRAYAQNLGGESWSPTIESFKAIDTRFTKDTMDGLVLWLDALDVDGDNLPDHNLEGTLLPVWVDKSRESKNPQQTVALQTPSYATKVFGSLPAVRFQSGDNYNVGSLNLTSGNIHVFAVAQGTGVVVGASDGLTGWTLDAKPGNRMGVYKSENNVLQRLTLGLDPQTGFGQLVGEIGEVMIFDRNLSPDETERVQGYLAHKWGVVDDLAQSGYKIRDGLMLYYPFDETDGSTVQDYSIELRDAQIVDASLDTMGKFGSGILFMTEMNNSMILLPEGNSFSLNNKNWTLSTWFSAPLPTTGVDHVHALFNEYLQPYVAINFSPKSITLFDGSSFADTNYEFDDAPGWRHLVVRSSTSAMDFFIDGILEDSVNKGVELNVESIGNLFGGYGAFSEKMDDFRIYSRGLTNSEIFELYGNGDGDFGVHPYEEFPPQFDNLPEIILPKNPLVYWTFNELNSSLWVRDDSGLDNHGYFYDESNATAPELFDHSESAKDGTGVRFDGNQTIRLEQNEATFDVKGPFSACLWVKTEDLDSDVLDSGRFGIKVRDGFLWGQAQVGGIIRKTESIALPTESWFHLILTWDEKKLRLFLNNQEASVPINTNGKLTGSGTLYLGGRNGITESFEGMIDDLRIFDQALSAAQRQEVYNFADPPLIAYFGEEYSYAVESIKGPTDFNATGLPDGLEIDPLSGLIFGEANQTGNFEVSVTASNFSGNDSKILNLKVNKGRQSILMSEDAVSLTYGNDPIEINATATSGLPVSLSILEGNDSIELSGSTITVKQTGFASLLASQPGDSNWLPAESLVLKYQVMSKEVLVTVDDQFRSPTESNPEFTFSINGLAAGDENLDFNVSVISPVADGDVSAPTPIGNYEITASGGNSENYLFAYQAGTLVVSSKARQSIVFDQDLSLVPANTPFVDLSGYSTDMLGNPTDLPLNFVVEDESVAKILETRKDALTAYWKLDENLYNGAKDEMNAYSGSLLNLPTTGTGKVWVPGRFGNAIRLGDPSSGKVDFGSVELDGNFSISFWTKPDDLTGDASVILSKNNINGMKVFKLEKGSADGSLRLYYYPDGLTEISVISSESDFLSESAWSLVTIIYDESAGSFKLFKNAELKEQANGLFFTSSSTASRFSNMILGDGVNAYAGIIDDLRVYGVALEPAELDSIYGDGFGDFRRIEIIGSGKTKITALQLGDDQYESSIPVDNYLTVYKVPQDIDFAPVKDHSVGDFPFLLSAGASSGLPVSFASSNPSVATTVGAYVYLHGPGEVTIVAKQAGSAKFEAAPDQNQTFQVKFGNLFADSTPGLKLWFDATDVNADSLPDDENDFIGNNQISMWADKSGNNNNPIQGNLLNMPRWTPAVLNAKPIVAFDSNLSFLLQNPVSGPSFVFLVHKQSSAGSSNVLGGDLATTSSNGFISLEHASGNVRILSESPSTEWSISTLRVLPNAQSLWVNGGAAGTDAFNQAAQDFDKLGNNFVGEIAEVLVFESELNTVTREKVEGYLAHKWGLEEKLLPSHPYFSEPPSFGGAQEIHWGGLIAYEEMNQTKYKLPDKAFGDLPFELQAFSTSGLPVSFVSSDSSIAAVTGNVLSIVGVGPVTISAIQMGDSRYHPAAPKSQVLHVIHPVVKDEQEISYDEIPIKVRDDPPFLLSALATSSGVNHPVFHLPVRYQVKSGFASVDSNGLVSLDGIAGTVVITAAQSGSAYVHPAPPVDITFEVSSKQRPKVLFKNLETDGNLTEIPVGHRPLVLQGVSSDNGKPFHVTSSNSSIVSVYNLNQVIPMAPGTVSLSFVIPESEFYLVSEVITKSITIVPPTREAWKKFRESDVRYDGILSRFSQRFHALNPSLSEFDAYEKARKVFNEDFSDSDGDGYSNLFERAIGTDSLGPDNRHNLPQQVLLPDNRQRITFVRYKTPLQTTGEAFEYHVEQSSNLQTWDKIGLMEERVVDLGENMERVTVATVSAIAPGQKKFLRLRISVP